MPIDIRLTAIPAPGGAPLAQSLAAATDAGDGAEDLAVPVQDAQEAGLDSRLNAPVAAVLAACEASGKAGDVAQAVTGQPGGPAGFFFSG